MRIYYLVLGLILVTMTMGIVVVEAKCSGGWCGVATCMATMIASVCHGNVTHHSVVAVVVSQQFARRLVTSLPPSCLTLDTTVSCNIILMIHCCIISDIVTMSPTAP